MMSHIPFKTIFLSIFISLILFNYNKNNNNKENLKKEMIQQKKEMGLLEKYYQLCDNGILLNNRKFKKVNNPKISIISPICNKEKYILRFLRSIQNQNFDDIEIILIDDYSKDNTVKLIEHYQEEDERIILLKHNKNMGTLISRNEGASMAKGDYIMFADPDDIISSDILDYGYKIIKTNDYDIVRYNIYNGNDTLNLDFIVNNLRSKPVYQPELSLYIFYGLGELKQTDYFIWNKIIKRKTFMFALENVNKYYLNQYMIDCEDGLMNFILHKTAQTFYFTKKIGYYYIINSESITILSKEKIKKRLKSNFLYLKFIFENTDDNKKEKSIAEYLFINIYNNFRIQIYRLLRELKYDSVFYIDVIKLYLNCEYISIDTKIILNKMKYMFST